MEWPIGTRLQGFAYLHCYRDVATGTCLSRHDCRDDSSECKEAGPGRFVLYVMCGDVPAQKPTPNQDLCFDLFEFTIFVAHLFTGST